MLLFLGATKIFLWCYVFCLGSLNYAVLVKMTLVKQRTGTELPTELVNNCICIISAIKTKKHNNQKKSVPAPQINNATNIDNDF
jgi:hypothetical protein